jgi:two-component sensor histidine kinase
MTLNELCTNTTKFGALSVQSGRVDIAWRLWT